MKNNKGIALFLAIGFVALSTAIILGLGVMLNSYLTTSTTSKEKEYSVHYANLALEEIKWNLEKKYKDWLYDATHGMGSDGYYDYDPHSTASDDVPLDGSSVNPDTDLYNYTEEPTQNFDSGSKYSDTYWIKVVDHYIWQDGQLEDTYDDSTNTQPLGRAEGWVRIAIKPSDVISEFTFIYDIFCKGTSYRGISMEKVGEQDYQYTGQGRKPRTTFIKSSAKKGDSLSLSEFNIAVFDGHINVGDGYNVFGRLHANEYIEYIDSASGNIENIAKFHNILSTSDEGSGFIFGGTQITPSDWNTWEANHKNDTFDTNDGSTINTYGFEGWGGAYSAFMGDLAKPAIIKPLKPKTDMHFDKVQNTAAKYGIWVKDGDVKFLFLHPGDPSVNGDGKVIIEKASGTVFVNGEVKSANPLTVNLADLETKIIYVDGENFGSVSDEGSLDDSKGYPVTSGIYTTKGIRGVAGVLDGQLSIFSGYDVVVAGDIIYQDYLDKINFTFTDYRSSISSPAFNYTPGTSTIDATYGIVRQAPLQSDAAIPDYNSPNLLGLNALHDVIIPGNMFNSYTETSSGWGGTSSGDYDSEYGGKYGSSLITDRCDQQGSGILSSGTASGDGKADIFTFGVIYAGHRVYGEVPSANEDTYYRPNNYVNNKGTWFIYGGVGCYKQVYATLTSGYGYNYRSYNYDPNLYNFEPPYTISIESQPIWNWRIVENYPDGITPK